MTRFGEGAIQVAPPVLEVQLGDRIKVLVGVDYQGPATTVVLNVTVKDVHNIVAGARELSRSLPSTPILVRHLFYVDVDISSDALEGIYGIYATLRENLEIVGTTEVANVINIGPTAPAFSNLTILNYDKV